MENDFILIDNRGIKRYKIPGANGLYVSDELQICDPSGSCVDCVVQQDGDDVVVSLPINGRTIERPVIWVYAFTRHCFPEYVNPDNVVFYRLPDFRGGIRWRAKFLKPYWYDETHRLSPMNPSVAVSRDGDVVDVATGFHYTWVREEYLAVTAFRTIQQNRAGVKVHLLVANAWISENQDSDHPYVNHIDGNKHNPCADNLEWVSSKENAVHAVANFLSPARGCRLRNKDTGEILKFESVKRVARFLGRKPDHLYHHKHRINKLFNGVYELRVDGDDRPWFYGQLNEVVMNDYPASSVIYRVLEPDGITRVFNGTEAFRSYYLPHSCSPITKTLAVKWFVKQYPQHLLTVVDQTDTRAIQILDIETSDVVEVPTSTVGMNLTGLTMGVFLYALESEGRKIADHYRIRHVSEADWPTETNKYDRVPLVFTNVLTGETQYIRSITLASERLRISPSVITRMLDHANPDDIWHVRVADFHEDSSETSREA